MKSLRSLFSKTPEQKEEYKFAQKTIFLIEYDKIVAIYPKFERRLCTVGFVICYDYDIFIGKDGCCRWFKMMEEDIVKLLAGNSNDKTKHEVAQVIVGKRKFDEIRPELFWSDYNDHLTNIKQKIETTGY